MRKPAQPLASLALVAIAALATTGYAQDPKPLPEAIAEFDRAVKSTLPRWLVQSLAELARSGAAAPKQRDKKAVRRMLKRCLSHREAEVRLAAVRAYGVLALPKSSRDLRSIVVNARRHSLELAQAAFTSWGLIHDPGTHEELLDYIKVPSRKKERRELARAAARAMPGYMGLSGRHRYEMLRDLMKTFDHIYSSTRFRYASHCAMEWWLALAPEMVASFNALTALKLRTYRECWAWWKRYHRQVKAGRA